MNSATMSLLDRVLLLVAFGNLILMLLPEQANADSGTTGRLADAFEVLLPAGSFGLTIAKNDREGSLQMLYGFAAAFGTTYALKSVVHGRRPEGNGEDSFPSGHTAITFHSASFLHERYGLKMALPLYVTAAWVGISRVNDDRHHWQDVLAGAVLGIAAGKFITTEYRGVRIEPEFATDYVGIRFSFNSGAR